MVPEITDQVNSTKVSMFLLTWRLLTYTSSNSTKKPHDFKWQSSVRVERTVRSSYFSHMIAVTMNQMPCVHLGPPTCCCYRRQTAGVIQYLGGDRVASRLDSCYPCEGSQWYWHLLCSNCRNALICVQSPHLSHESSLINCWYPRSWRVCWITRTIPFLDDSSLL
jgi:hypothetical protein